MRFLIFEDNVDMAVLYRRALPQMFGQEAHFELRIVDSINAGMSELRTYHARIIILDLNLPPMRPKEVRAHIPELREKADVIVVSEDVSAECIEESILAGANDFIPKSLLFDNSTGDGRLGIYRLISRFGASYYRSKRDHGN